MSIQKYSVNQLTVQTVLSYINAGEIAIPEIQRPFVWDATKVRDLIDSLFQGYPIGYLISWRNPTIRLKDGTESSGKRILIDGQQRVTALMAALLGREVINNDYRRTRIVISFHPLDRRFEVANPAIKKDGAWVYDISAIMQPDVKLLQLVKDYCEKNVHANQDDVFGGLELLRGILNNTLGVIDLDSGLDIETVTDIFIRINSQGVVLSQADFVMSKIAANEQYGGHELRKCIDYFSHMSVDPAFYQQIISLDQAFAQTDYFKKMAWLKNENDDIYDPSYTDMLRVSFTSEFKRGRLQDLVALLSGRNFSTRTYEEAIAEESFARLKAGIMMFMGETGFKRFVMIVRSAGFVDSLMIRSQNALNFSYIVYLVLVAKNTAPALIERLVRRWLVMSVLTGRYSGSAESQFDFDIQRIEELGVEQYLNNIERAELSDAFWSVGLAQQFNTSVASSPYFKVFLAAQVKMNDKGFLSKDITVRELITHRGDVHHLFPKQYLKKQGLGRGRYNQIANYVMTQSEINIAIKDRAPSVYFSELLAQCGKDTATFGAICDYEAMLENFKAHCIPDGMENKDFEHYDSFLEERQKLMALKIRDYYRML